MKIDRLSPETYKQGMCLSVVETEEAGQSKLEVLLPQAGVLFQYSSKIHFIFKNKRRADGILFVKSAKRWDLFVIELKKTVKPKEWQKIKEQWHGAWLHAMALSGVLGASLSGNIRFVVAFQNDRIIKESPNPVFLKMSGKTFPQGVVEWGKGKVVLEELGEVAFEKVQLDERGEGIFRVLEVGSKPTQWRREPCLR